MKLNKQIKIMDFSSFLDHTSNQIQLDKSSPTTSAGTSSEIDEQILIDDNSQLADSHYQLSSFNNKQQLEYISTKRNPQIKQQYFQQVETEIMSYFKAKDIHAGNPGDFKKQFNKKLHMRVAMLVEVNQVVTKKANAGSSLLSRRLDRKMTITL